MNHNHNLSIDIGGTKVAVIVYGQDLTATSKIDLPTSEFLQGNGESDLHTLFAHLATLLSQHEFDTVGISMKSALHNNHIHYSSLLKNTGPINLQPIVEQYFTYKNLQSDNDVCCMANAEMKLGVGQHTNSFLYVNLGTGIRIVYVENNTIIRGFNNLAGEISGQQVWVQETNSYWKLEELLGGMGLPKLSQAILGQEHHGEAFFQHEDQRLVTVYTSYLAQFLHTVSFFYNPEIIVFGGSLTKSADMWLNKTKEKYFAFRPNFLLSKDICISSVQHPASLGAIL